MGEYGISGQGNGDVCRVVPGARAHASQPAYLNLPSNCNTHPTPEHSRILSWGAFPPRVGKKFGGWRGRKRGKRGEEGDGGWRRGGSRRSERQVAGRGEGPGATARLGLMSVEDAEQARVPLM